MTEKHRSVLRGSDALRVLDNAEGFIALKATGVDSDQLSVAILGLVETLDQILDAQERIQEQLALLTGTHLNPGERIQGGI